MAKRVVGFIVYSVEMAKASREHMYKVLRQEPPALDDEDGLKIQERWGRAYVQGFIPDEYNGAASWGCRQEAYVWRTLEEAIAVVLQVSEHEGVGQAVVLDAQTQEHVDSASWVPRRPSHPDSLRSRLKRKALAEKELAEPLIAERAARTGSGPPVVMHLRQSRRRKRR